MLITNPEQLASNWDWRVTPVTATMGGVLCRGDRSRVLLGLSISLLGAEVFVGPVPSINQDVGYSLNTSNTPLNFPYREYGGMIQDTWFCWTMIGGVIVNVVEVFYRPQLLLPGETSNARSKGIHFQDYKYCKTYFGSKP